MEWASLVISVKCTAIVRGHLARLKVLRIMANIPHVLRVYIKNAKNNKNTAAIISSKCHISVNIVIGGNDELRCFSSVETNQCSTTELSQPTWEEKIFLSVSGVGLISFNLMSPSSFGTAETFIGQNFIPLNELTELYKGEEIPFSLNLKGQTLPVFDPSGTKLSTQWVPNEEKGVVDMTLSIPDTYHNLCGWFTEVKPATFFVSASLERIWVIIYKNSVRCYDKPLQTELKNSFDCEEIVSLQDEIHNQASTAIKGITLTLKDGRTIYWGWNDKEAKFKGLWKNALLGKFTKTFASPTKLPKNNKNARRSSYAEFIAKEEIKKE